MSDDGGAAIEDFYLEERLFAPPEGFVDQVRTKPTNGGRNYAAMWPVTSDRSSGPRR